MQTKIFHFVSVVMVLALALGLAGTIAAPVHAQPELNPAPVQTFYVTLPEADGLTVLKAINSNAIAPMHTYFSIAIATDGTWVYYDHWEDGYEADIANPTQSTTQIWGNGLAADGCAPNKSGAPVTCTDGNDVLNAGDVVVPYNTVPIPVPLTPSVVQSYVLDQFSSQSYSNNHGNTNWSGSWVERNDSGAAQSPTDGRIRITSNQLRFREANANDAIDRGVDLSNPGACAVLSFALGQNAIDNSGDNFSVRISSDGTNYTVLDTFTGSGSAGNKSYNISAYATANTRIRFHADQDLENNEYWSVDNVRVEWDCSVLFNAKDKVGATKSIAMARATWASGSNTLNAFAHEMYSTNEWGTVYEAPVGPTTINSGDMFEYSGLTIMASQNGTIVQVDADANGSFDTTVTLNEGQATLVPGTKQGARVQADKPVQVTLVTGDIGSNYASRDMSLLPVSAFGSSAWSPVGVVNSSYNTRLFLYRPRDSAGPSHITCVRRDGGSTFTSTQAVSAGGVVTMDLTNEQGARCHASDVNGTEMTDPIFGVATIDTTNTAFDWSFTMYPDSFLTTDALVGLGLGRDPTSNTNPTENGNPVWVTAACTTGSTYVYVDWNNDGTPDLIDLNGNGNTNDINVDGINETTSNQGIPVNRLQSVRLFRPSVDRPDPYDQTGARIWSRTASGAGTGGTPGCNLALAWGQDPRNATAGAPGLDVGTSVPPLRLVESTKSLSLKTDADGDGLLSPGDTATYLITVHNAGPTLVSNVHVYDTVPANTTYVLNSTAKDLGAGWTPIADDAPPTAFPLDTPPGVYLGTLAPKGTQGGGDTFYVRFDVLLGAGEYGEINNCSLSSTVAGNLERCAINQVASMDWGDLPDSYGTSAATNGPRHTPSNLRLGAWFDRELQGQPTTGANGDDANETTLPKDNDEDGVVFLQGSYGTNEIGLKVTVADTSNANTPACLNAWMDFTNGTTLGEDGDFNDAYQSYSEHVIQNSKLLPGEHLPVISLPSGLLTDQPASFYFRFRLSPTDVNGNCTAPIAPTGFVSGGEVEDYRFSFEPTSGPLAVTLAGFEAQGLGDRIVVSWETVSEMENAGFNLYRTGSADDQPGQGNLLAYVPSQAPGSTQGAAYSYEDLAVQPGQTYFYTLEDVALSGATTQHGPVSATVQAPTAVTLSSVSATPAAAGSALLPWLLAAAGASAGAALALGRRRR